MSRRAIMSLVASVIFGIGFILTVSTDASAYYRGGVYRGGVYRGGVYRGGYYRGVRPGDAARTRVRAGRVGRADSAVFCRSPLRAGALFGTLVS